jgi:hypothetical protein
MNRVKRLTMDKILEFLNKDQLRNIHVESFKLTFLALQRFIEESSVSNVRFAYVCDSAAGVGKTTALAVVIKYFSSLSVKPALLLVFNNTDTMSDFYKDVLHFAKENHKNKLIQYVVHDNLENVLTTLSQFQIVCVTHQRFRDLALNLGEYSAYNTYIVKGERKERLIIVDEMPSLFNDVVFDISTSNNSVEWFDELAKSSQISPADKHNARALIMGAIAVELYFNQGVVTTRLIQGLSHLGTALHDIMQKLKPTVTNREAFLKYQWFMRLLQFDGEGFIDRGHDKSVILCSERVDYKKLGSILILDGTSPYSEHLYNGEYQYVHVDNPHNYAERLRIHWRDINTSKTARERKDKSVQAAIAEDIQSIRVTGINPFPLMAKMDIDIYTKNGVITQEQTKLFVKEGCDDDMPLNLLNTTGKNVLNEYTSIALLNMPILPPEHYKKVALSIYGTNLDGAMADKGNGSWFQDQRIQTLYEEITLAEVLQIIHRSKLRVVNDTSEIHIYIYSNRTEWQSKIQTALNLPVSNISLKKLTNISLYNLQQKAEQWAKVSREYIDANPKLFGGKYTAKEIGKGVKNFLNRNYQDSKKAIINSAFNGHRLKIITDERGWKHIQLIEHNEK